MAGLTNNGWETKRLPEILTDLRTRAGVIFQDLLEDPNDVVDTSEDSTIGRFIGLITPAITDLWEAGHGMYTAFDPNSATRIPLDNIVALSGITRLSQLPTRADMYLTASVGITVPSASVVRSDLTAIDYSTVSDVVFDPTQTVGVGINVVTLDVNNSYTIRYRASSDSSYISITVSSTSTPSIEGIYSAFETAVQNNHQDLYTSRENGRLFIRPVTNFQLFDFEVSDNLAISKVVKTVAVEASVAGPIEQAANTIATIRTPVLGWDSATNPQAASAGRYEETDEQLRARWRNTKFQFATNIVESLYSSIFSLEGVTNVVIYENDTDEVDEIGVNPHSFLTLVDGGLESDIAKAIWQNRPAGIGSQGNTAIDIVDSFGYVRTVNFSRPVEVPIFIELSIQTDSRFPEDGENKIREALISYINNLTINDDVVYSRLYTPINTVAGHQVNSLRIGTSSDNLGFSNVTTNFDEIAKTQAVNIVFV